MAACRRVRSWHSFGTLRVLLEPIRRYEGAALCHEWSRPWPAIWSPPLPCWAALEPETMMRGTNWSSAIGHDCGRGRSDGYRPRPRRIRHLRLSISSITPSWERSRRCAQGRSTRKGRCWITCGRRSITRSSMNDASSNGVHTVWQSLKTLRRSTCHLSMRRLARRVSKSTSAHWRRFSIRTGRRWYCE